MAEAVFQDQVKQRSNDVQGKIVKIDSCGTGAYHVGDDPDERTVQTCKKVRPTAYTLNPICYVLIIRLPYGTAAQGTYKFGRQSLEQGGLSRVYPYPRNGPDEVSTE